MLETSVIKQMLTGLPFTAEISHITPLKKGFSTDDKFILYVEDAPTYLLRISPLRDVERRQKEFDILTQLDASGIPCSRPYHFKVVPEADLCLSLLGYLPGDCAEEAMPADADSQYAIGIQVGKVLRQMHEAIAAPGDIDFPALRSAKYRRFLQITQEHDLSFEHQAVVEEYVSANILLMQNRPLTFLHDDYHPGNLIISGGRFVGIIDFNRIDWGDPYRDFYKMAHFGAPRFPAFARGQVDGYFDGFVPKDFWPLYTLYTAMSLHSALAWTQRFWPERLDDSYRRIAAICTTHDFNSGAAPQWYLSDNRTRPFS